MNISLYKAADDVRKLFDQMDAETGELPEGFEPAREIVIRKSAAVAAYILESDKQADMVEGHGKTFIDAAKKQRARNDRLRDYLKTHMALAGITEIKDDTGTFKAKLLKDRDEAVEVFDAAQVPVNYMTDPKPPEPAPDKALIKKALKDGFNVPGARIVKRDRLEIK